VNPRIELRPIWTMCAFRANLDGNDDVVSIGFFIGAKDKLISAGPSKGGIH